MATAGGSFSFSSPVDAVVNVNKGSVSVTEKDGGTATYTWELTRR